MKNIRFNDKIGKKFTSFILVGTMALSVLSGCGKSEENSKSFLSDTKLEATKVITFEDGHKDIASFENYCDKNNCDPDHKIYNSIITNEYFTNNDCVMEYLNEDDLTWNYSNPLNKYNITNEESIVSYLTADELLKASKGELADDDIISIINRILEKEETTKKVK